jgi:ubiquinone/menaquinone biosynthesis C-methylase UbiE
MSEKKRLDIGCGNNKMPGATYIDIDPDVHPDIVHDLNKFPYPIADNSFDEIYAKHIIEHLNDPVGFMKEMARVLKPGGTIFVETPHFSSRVAYSEPQHKLFFSYFMFNSLINKLPLEVMEQKMTFYKSFRTCGIAALANKYPDSYERFWTYMFPAENVILKARKKSG